MLQFMLDIQNCLVSFGQFLSMFGSSLWVYPLVLLFFTSVVFFMVTKND